MNLRKNVDNIVVNIKTMALFRCQRVLLNETMKPSRLQEHMTKVHADQKDLSFFKPLKKIV